MGSTQAIKQAIRAGFGVSLISRRAVEDECRAGLLGCVRVRDLDVSRAFHLVTHRDRSRSPLAQAFLAFVESQSPDRPSSSRTMSAMDPRRSDDRQADPSHFLRRLRRLSVQDGSWRSPGGAGGLASGRVRRARRSARRSRAHRRRRRLSPAPDLAIVETVDFFPPVVDDPWTGVPIAAVNAMSDVYAMGGEVLFALAVAGFPRDFDKKIITEVFRGGAEKVRRRAASSRAATRSSTPSRSTGSASPARVDPERILIKGGLRPGDRVFLSKPLGTGVITTAAKNDKATAGCSRARWSAC